MLASFTQDATNADDHAADVYQTDQLNTKQETKTVNIISILPQKLPQTTPKINRNCTSLRRFIGAVAGGISATTSGLAAIPERQQVVGGGAAGQQRVLVNDKTLVEGVSLTYKEGTVYTTQVGKECQFTTGLAVITRITKRVFSQIPKCPEKS